MLGKKAEPRLGVQGHRDGVQSPRTRGARTRAGGRALGYSAGKAGFAGKGPAVTSVQSREAVLRAVCQNVAAEAEAVAVEKSTLTDVLTVNPAHTPITSHHHPCSPTIQDQLFHRALPNPQQPPCSALSPDLRP